MKLALQEFPCGISVVAIMTNRDKCEKTAKLDMLAELKSMHARVAVDD